MRDENKVGVPNRTVVGQTDQGIEQDTQRLHSIVGMAAVMMSNPLDSMPRYITANLVKGHVDAVREIQDPRTRQLALNCIAEMGFAQKHYQAEVERQAPDLLERAKAANAAIAAELGDDYQPPANVRAGMLRAGIGGPEEVAAAQASMRGRGRR